MASLIDTYSDCTKEYEGKWFIAKPLRDTRIKTIIHNTIGVLRGKYTAIYFKEDMRQKYTP